jgi:hypothetical protein
MAGVTADFTARQSSFGKPFNFRDIPEPTNE